MSEKNLLCKLDSFHKPLSSLRSFSIRIFFFQFFFMHTIMVAFHCESWSTLSEHRKLKWKNKKKPANSNKCWHRFAFEPHPPVWSNFALWQLVCECMCVRTKFGLFLFMFFINFKWSFLLDMCWWWWWWQVVVLVVNKSTNKTLNTGVISKVGKPNRNTKNHIHIQALIYMNLQYSTISRYFFVCFFFVFCHYVLVLTFGHTDKQQMMHLQVLLQWFTLFLCVLAVVDGCCW